MNWIKRRSWAVGVVVGVPVGMALAAALAGALPLFVALPGGGERCWKCHELHGGIRIDGIKTDGWIHLTGDVPRPVWIDTGEMFRTHQVDRLPGVTLLDLLAEHGVDHFSRAVVASLDGGHVSIESGDITSSTRLVPRLGVARFADEHLHSSAWLRAVVEICVVADEPAIQVDGRRTTYGALLAGDRTAAVTESARTAQDDQATGRAYRNVTSRIVTGVPLARVIDPSCGRVTVTAGGESNSFDVKDVRDAVMCRDEHDGAIMLVLPRRSRSEWPRNVTALHSGP